MSRQIWSVLNETDITSQFLYNCRKQLHRVYILDHDGKLHDQIEILCSRIFCFIKILLLNLKTKQTNVIIALNDNTFNT